MKTKADLQMRLAEIKIRGYIKDWDEFVLLFMIMTGQIEMPDGALYDAGSRDAKDLRDGRGLFNPLKQIKAGMVRKRNLEKFAQHFPMLFRAGETPQEAIRRLSDYLYAETPGEAGAAEWMDLIKRQGPGPTNAYV